MLMDAAKDEIQKIILVNLSVEESQLVQTVPTTPPLDISIDRMLNEMTPLYQVAISILGEAAQGGFSRICKSIHKNFKIPADKLPSYYMLVKERPKMIYFEIDAPNNSPADVENVENNYININSTTNNNI